MLDAVRVEITRPADHAVDHVAFVQKLFCEIRAVLSGDAGDECGFQSWYTVFEN